MIDPDKLIARLRKLDELIVERRGGDRSHTQQRPPEWLREVLNCIKPVAPHEFIVATQRGIAFYRWTPSETQVQACTWPELGIEDSTVSGNSISPSKSHSAVKALGVLGVIAVGLAALLMLQSQATRLNALTQQNAQQDSNLNELAKAKVEQKLELERVSQDLSSARAALSMSQQEAGELKKNNASLAGRLAGMQSLNSKLGSSCSRLNTILRDHCESDKTLAHCREVAQFDCNQ
ncbi:hypothetical protein [Bradyrhizobium japonicum]|uniref:hypothetical protein n=1 Tax=Bradyrhizobium japonicum TaxID=375 RepID=UPI001E55504C|nr:hypothetical protein [Bradyrhizobium japonicum]MCD9892073.1 hypothetical protein [Bradyrhizobium japonicum]WRJ83897.1 hypothetical protein R3F78_02940 [Bradyrhizobium japonicum]WRJ92866.1 hypothetical protein R3F77_00655 [Bradyrhizobium japonicum]WRK46717.1 hypothetical protein R3F73_00710 [Bradyrhizobium japonicum]